MALLSKIFKIIQNFPAFIFRWMLRSVMEYGSAVLYCLPFSVRNCDALIFIIYERYVLYSWSFVGFQSQGIFKLFHKMVWLLKSFTLFDKREKNETEGKKCEVVELRS